MEYDFIDFEKIRFPTDGTVFFLRALEYFDQSGEQRLMPGSGVLYINPENVLTVTEFPESDDYKSLCVVTFKNNSKIYCRFLK